MVIGLRGLGCTGAAFGRHFALFFSILSLIWSCMSNPGSPTPETPSKSGAVPPHATGDANPLTEVGQLASVLIVATQSEHQQHQLSKFYLSSWCVNLPRQL